MVTYSTNYASEEKTDKQAQVMKEQAEKKRKKDSELEIRVELEKPLASGTRKVSIPRLVKSGGKKTQKKSVKKK